MTLQLKAPASEEAELFKAVTAINLADALKHLRTWTSCIDDQHRNRYADLIEAQAKLIAWFVNKAAPKAPVADAVRRWLHVKRGTTYTEVGRGKFQIATDAYGALDMMDVVIYRAEHDGALWVRPVVEFEDGRFAALSPAPGADREADSVLNDIREALETRGYVHMANGRDIGAIIDELSQSSMRDVLKPFAAAADNYADASDDEQYIDADATVTVGNLRDARAALAAQPVVVDAEVQHAAKLMYEGLKETLSAKHEDGCLFKGNRNLPCQCGFFQGEEDSIGHRDSRGSPDAVQAARIETRAEALQEAAAYVRLRGNPQLAADILTIPGASPTVTDGETA